MIEVRADAPALLLAALLAAPSALLHAQPGDPLSAIVSQPDGSIQRLARAWSVRGTLAA